MNLLRRAARAVGIVSTEPAPHEAWPDDRPTQPDSLTPHDFDEPSGVRMVQHPRMYPPPAPSGVQPVQARPEDALYAWLRADAGRAAIIQSEVANCGMACILFNASGDLVSFVLEKTEHAAIEAALKEVEK